VDKEFRFPEVAMSNLYDVRVASDGTIVLCQVEQEDSNTTVVLLRIVRRGEGLFVQPPAAPSRNTMEVVPWLLYAKLSTTPREVNQQPNPELIVDGIRIHHQTPIEQLREHATVSLGNGNHIVIEVPRAVRGRHYTARDGYQGKLQFDVLESQTVWIALYGKDWGGGGNPSGDWQPELVTREELERQGWKQVGMLPVKHSDPQFSDEPSWILVTRNCEAGETFLIRNHKYQAPVLIWGAAAADD
jgi:hypothetical protein